MHDKHPNITMLTGYVDEIGSEHHFYYGGFFLCTIISPYEHQAWQQFDIYFSYEKQVANG